MTWRLWVQTPCEQFLTKYVLFCVTLYLSDNLTETLIVKTQLVDLGGVRGRCQNFFIFRQFSGKIRHIGGWRTVRGCCYL